MLTELCRSQLNDRNNAFPFHNEETESYDCNVAMCSQSVEIVTGAQLDAATVRQIGRDPAGGSGNRMVRRVFRDQGMVEGTDYMMLRNAPTQTVRDLLSTGWFVVGYIMYGTLREYAPEIVCDSDYKGAHAVGMSGWWRRGVRKVHYHDPLADGRRASVPKGVQTAPFSALRNAMWTYSEAYGAGAGLVSGYAVKPKAKE